jgi:integrase
VDFEEKALVVAETVYQGRSSTPKTRASKVRDLAIEALTHLKSRGGAANDFVFKSESGTSLSPNNVRNRVLIPACKRVGIPLVGWRTFRYTYSTWGKSKR